MSRRTSACTGVADSAFLQCSIARCHRGDAYSSSTESIIGHHVVNPFMPPGALIKDPSDTRRLRVATASCRNAWIAVVFSYSLFGFVMYWPQLTKHHLHGSTIVGSMLLLIALSLITSIYVVALAYRLTAARIFGAINVLMNVGLVAVLAFIYWVLNYSGIEFGGPG